MTNNIKSKEIKDDTMLTISSVAIEEKKSPSKKLESLSVSISETEKNLSNSQSSILLNH